MKNITKHIFNTNYQKILRFLLRHPVGDYVEKDIQQATHISKAGVNFAIKDLAKDGLVNVQKKGRFSFYAVNLDNPMVRQLKVLINITDLNFLIKDLKKVSDKIILFGSSATGTNIKESDIDLFILASQPQKVLDVINASLLAEKIQAVIKKPADYLTLKKKDPIFYEEISRGILIWEKK